MKLRRVPIVPTAVGLVVAAFLFVLLPSAKMPLELVSLLSGRDVASIDINGGAVFTLRVDSDDPLVVGAVAHNAKARCASVGYLADARLDSDDISLAVLDVGVDARWDIQRLLSSGASLEFKLVVDGTERMKEVARRAADDPRVDVDDDGWAHRESGKTYQDTFVFSQSADDLIAFLADIEPEPGREFALELETVRGMDGQKTQRWRSYYLDDTVYLRGDDVEHANSVYNSTTGQPEVVVDFTERGARAFAELTSRNVGHKIAIVADGVVVSAPVIQAAITGGTSNITMGAGNAREVQIQTDNLIAALRAGPMPAPVEIVNAVANPPNVSAAVLVVARLTLALLFGLLAFGATTALQRALRPLPPIAQARTVRGGMPVRARPWRRLAVTVAGPVAVILLQRVSLPTVDDQVADWLVGPGQETRISVFALGVWPMLAGFVTAEIVALIVPRWRRRRYEPAFRPNLAVAGAALGIGFALIQGWTAAMALDSLPFIELPGTFRPVTALSFAAGTLVLVVLASVIGRYGLGNGYSIVLATGLLTHAYETARYMASATPTPVVLCSLATGVCAVVLATVWILRARGDGMRLPAGGVVPLAWSGAAVQLIALLAWAGLDVPFKWVSVLAPASLSRFAVLLGLLVVLGALCSYAFSRARPLSAPNLASTSYLALLAAIGFAIAHYAPEAWFDLFLVVLGTAVAMDVWDEWRARSRHPDLAILRNEHRVQRVDDILDALLDAGIPAHARGAAHRALLHFFAPYVPVSIYVPADRLAEARDVLSN